MFVIAYIGMGQMYTVDSGVEVERGVLNENQC